MSYLKNVAIVGASGRIGSFITSALLSGGKHNITAITRSDSKSTFPPRVTSEAVDYSDPSTLVEALKGKDILLICIALMAPPDTQTKLIHAAASAGVPWVMPNEWGSDTEHPAFKRNPIDAKKQDTIELIEKLGMNWMALCCNQWWEWSLGGGLYGIDIPNRKVRFYDDGTAKTVTTTWPRVGEAVEKLLALPLESSGGSTLSLEKYKNKHVYVSSFYLSQREILDAVERNTRTTDSDWEIMSVPVVETMENALEDLKKGDFIKAMPVIVYAGNFMPDGGNDFVKTKETLNQVLGFEQEDLDEATKRAIEYSMVHKPV